MTPVLPASPRSRSRIDRTACHAMALLAGALWLGGCSARSGGDKATQAPGGRPAAAASPAADPLDHGADPAGPIESNAQAATLTGFTDQIAFSGLTNPIAVRFASNGKVFVAEENGRIYFFDNLSDTTPTLFADLRDEVNSYWDRGLLGFTLDPNYATNGFLYILYDHDTATNAENGTSTANRNVTDNCPDPPGGTTQACITYGRLSRLHDPGSGYPIAASARLDLITEWPQQFPSHSIGALNFGPDGNLYATAGEGASFGPTDYGNFGIPKNPLGDPPAGVGGTMTAPTARGGSSRSQSFRRPAGENVTMNGTLIRVDPGTGAAAAGNPNLTHPDVDAKRIIAIGLRNPYRFTFHPVTGDIWIADVGGSHWEEIDRIPAPLTNLPMKNFGWPCYEGHTSNADKGHNTNWDALNVDICESLYANGANATSAYTDPFFAYEHGAKKVFAADTCGTGGAAITGVAIYPPSGAGNYPASYKGALFFADLPRNCIWVMTPDANGVPSVANTKNFIVAAASPVELTIGPNNDLFYVDYGGTGGQGTNVGAGKIHRVRYQAPTAIASANPTSGASPLTVVFDGSASTPGIAGDTLSYAWDLDGDGQYDDSTVQKPSRTYTTAGTVSVRLKVSDQRGGSNESAALNILVGSTLTPPMPVIDSPAVALTWKVGDPIAFSGHATDPEDGTIPATGLLWDVIMKHCPSDCHEHLLQSFDGVASGSFPAPDHEYPSYLQLRLTATDSNGLRTTVSRDLQPQTVNLTLVTSPNPTPGLTLGFNLEAPPAPVTRTVIKGSANSVSAPDQSRGTTTYTFQSWSDGGGQSHEVVTALADATYTANYVATVTPWVSQDIGAVMPPAGTWSEAGGVHTITGGGADIWNAADEFRFTYQQISGDATITARVTALGNTNAFAKAGVMFRQSLNANSVNVHALISPVATSGFRYTKRVTTGATTTAEFITPSPLPGAPGWVRVKRVGDLFTAFTSTDGATFTQLGTPQTIAMGASVYVGLAVTSHLDGTSTTAKFDNVSITTPTPLPPAAPAGLAATAGNGQVVLSWNSVAGASSYTVKRGSLNGGPYTDFTQGGVTATNYTNTGLVNDTTYFYVVTASNAAGEGGNSNQAQATPQVPPPPAAPSGLSATAGNNLVSLTWNASAGATSYTVKRGLTAGGPYTDFTQSGVAVTNYSDSGAVNGTTYYYVVSASNANGESVDSAETSATPSLPPAPPAPTNLGAVAGNAQVSLSWTASPGAASYTVKRGSIAGGPYTDFTQGGITGTSFTNTGLGNGTTYYYVVSASNPGGESPDSAEKSATPQLPPPPAAPTGLLATAGNAKVDLGWTASAGATSYTVKRALTAGGPYTITQAGIAGTTFSNTGLVNGTTYFYVVSASNANGEGANSAEKAATPVAPAAPISNLVVNDTATTNPPAGTDGIANSLQWSIQSNFQVNVVAFGDRTVKVTAVPAAGAALLGKSWIRTAADSKNYTATTPPLATFTVGGTFVTLAVDNRHNGTGTRPAWLDATYVDQGYDITITEGTTARPYSVYRKPVTAGSTVTLPTVGSTVAPLYLVIVQ